MAAHSGPGAGTDLLVHILWMNGGLGCDGDSVALTAATQPSIEEIALGALPGLPSVGPALAAARLRMRSAGRPGQLHRVVAPGRAGELNPFVLVVEGSIPNEAMNTEGYWCGFGNNPETGQPMTTNEWLDRLTPKATAILAVGTCATYGGIHAIAGNPTGAMGVPDYLGWDWRSKAGLPIVCVPGCPIHPDNLAETILYLLYLIAGQAPMIPLDEALRPTWLLGSTVHEGCDRAGYYERATSPPSTARRSAWSSWAAGLLGARPSACSNAPTTRRSWSASGSCRPSAGGYCNCCRERANCARSPRSPSTAPSTPRGTRPSIVSSRSAPR